VDSSQREVLAHAIRDLSRGAALEKLLPELCAAVARAVAGDAAAVFFRQALSVFPSSGYGYGLPITTEQGSVLAEKLLAEPGVAQGRPEVLPAKQPSGSGLGFLAASGVRRVAVCPIVFAGTPLGVLCVFDLGNAVRLGRQELELLEAASGVLALAVENARLTQRDRLIHEEIDAVQRASAGIASSLELPRVLDSILSTALELVPAEIAHVFLYADGRLTFGAAIGPDGSWDHPFSEPRPEGLTYTVARSGRPVVVDDMRRHALYSNAPRDWGRAIVGLPLKNGSRVVGVMNISRLSSQPFDETELRILEMLAGEAAISIENAYLYQSERRQRLRRESLQAAAAIVSRSLDLSEVLDRILTEIRTVIPYDSASVMLVREGGLEIVAGRGLPEEAGPGRLFPPTELEKDIEATGRPLILHDASADPRFAAWGNTTYVHGWMGIPLVAPGGLIGFLTLDSRQPGAYKPADGELALSFASQAAVAVENARLHESVKDQLAALKESRTRLLQSEKLAAIGELVAGVAHELNNPLTAIIGIAQVVQSSEGGDRLRPDLERLVQEAHRTGKIVRNLLDFARQRPPERRAVQLNDVVRRSLRILEYQMSSHGIGLETHLDPDLPQTMADPHQLQQVVVNLLNNAVEAMKGSSGRVLVRTELAKATQTTPPERPEAAPPRAATAGVEGAPERFLLIVVEDEGPGVPEEIRPHIFDPFFSTKGPARGTGLGLSVCHGIVTEHGGRIRVETAGGPTGTGTGASFVVELPFVAPGTDGSGPPQGQESESGLDARLPPPAATTRRSVAPRILVVEDEEPVRGLMLRVMGRAGYAVEVCADGQEALERLRGEPFDLIVCDIRMPRLSGPELYLRLTQEMPGAAPHVLFITGDTVRADTRAFIEETDVPVLLKPFDMGVLLARVEDMLGRTPASPQSSPPVGEA
jgi:signal transduction histidine kinase/CheY-like chemotaxis protein